MKLIKINLFYLNEFDLEGHFKGHTLAQKNKIPFKIIKRIKQTCPAIKNSILKKCFKFQIGLTQW